jgi:hypothetical protein
VQCLGVDTLHVAGRVYVPGQRGEHNHAQRSGNENADTETPQQFSSENAPFVYFGMELGHGLPHRAPRQEYKQIDRQVAEHQQSNCSSSEDSRAKRHDAHHLRERSFIHFIGIFQGGVGGGGLIRLHNGPKCWRSYYLCHK